VALRSAMTGLLGVENHPVDVQKRRNDRRNDKFITPERLNCRSLGSAPNEQKIKPIKSILISSVNFTLNLPQASQLDGMTKGRVALPFGVIAVMIASRTSFIPFPTCRKQVRLLLMNQGFRSNWVRVERTVAPLRFAPVGMTIHCTQKIEL
jgi:hypothetical protein